VCRIVPIANNLAPFTMKNILVSSMVIICLFSMACEDEDIKLKSDYGKFGLVITNRFQWQTRPLKIFESVYNQEFRYYDSYLEIKGVKHKYVDLDIICDKIDSLIPVGNVFYNGLIPIDANYKIMIVGEILKNGRHNDTLIIDDIKIGKDECFVKHIELNPE
jgi:hypothetical protein